MYRRNGSSELTVIQLVGLAGVACVVLGGGCFFGSKVQLADGYRDSTFRRLSETGVVWKTAEVEMLGDGFKMADNKAVPETFQYTVHDPAVVEQFRRLPADAKVRVHYRKNLTAWYPTGESRYVATAVEAVK